MSVLWVQVSLENLFHRGKVRAEWVCEYRGWVSKYGEHIHNTEKLWDPTARKDKSSWDPQTREGLGTDAAVGGLLCPRDVAAVGSWCCCGMGVMRQGTDGTQLAVFDTKKSSPMDSVSKLRKRVQRTRFPGLKNESIGLGFQAWKPSSVNSFFKLRNQVHWTRLGYE